MYSRTRILNYDVLLSHGNVEGRKVVLDILEAGLKAADPYYNILKLVKRVYNKLIVGYKDFEPPGDPSSGDLIIDLDKVGSIYVVGAAKGVQSAAKALEDILGDRLTEGHVIAKKGDEKILNKIKVTFGAHPVPDEDCAKGAQAIYEIAKKVRKGDVVFTLSGNGGSSLLTLPPPGISIEDVRELTYMMQVERGVPTEDLNVIRNHIDLLKVGRMSLLMKDALQIHILLWDAGDPLPSKTGISGYEKLLSQNRWLHALPDSTTFKDAYNVLKKWNVLDKIPPSIRKHIEEADPKYETPKKEDFKDIKFRVFGILPRRGPITEASRKAESLGYTPIILTEWLQAEAREAGKVIASIAKNIEFSERPFRPPCVLLTTGELIVTVGEHRGIGGRNQEFTLSAALQIRGSKKVVIGAVDTDGTDGPGTQFVKDYGQIPCLAGGLVDGNTAEEAEAKGINIFEELKNHNSTIPLLKLNSGIITTQGVSLNDLSVTLILK
ncbi:MAG: DUF4147 domain-containing protein [Nitrososphaeria archaeon]